MNQFSTCAIRFSSLDILIQREDCFKEASRQIQHAKSNRVFFLNRRTKVAQNVGFVLAAYITICSFVWKVKWNCNFFSCWKNFLERLLSRK